MGTRKKRSKAGRPNTGRPRKTSEAYVLRRYEVTDQPILDAAYRRMPDEVKDNISRLHHLATNHPEDAIDELKALLVQYPQIPQFYNYLTMCYAHTGQVEKAEETALAGIAAHPHYLFTRINYAEICLQRGEYDKVAEIFDHKFDLTLLYPNRRRFHVSEVVGFMGLMGMYFYETGQRDIARQFLDILRKLAPGSLMTKRLKRRLSPSLLDRLRQRRFG